MCRSIRSCRIRLRLPLPAAAAVEARRAEAEALPMAVVLRLAALVKGPLQAVVVEAVVPALLLRRQEEPLPLLQVAAPAAEVAPAGAGEAAEVRAVVAVPVAGAVQRAARQLARQPACKLHPRNCPTT
jgi:hypothetical protein